MYATSLIVDEDLPGIRMMDRYHHEDVRIDRDELRRLRAGGAEAMLADVLGRCSGGGRFIAQRTVERDEGIYVDDAVLTASRVAALVEAAGIEVSA